MDNLHFQQLWLPESEILHEPLPEFQITQLNAAHRMEQSTNPTNNALKHEQPPPPPPPHTHPCATAYRRPAVPVYQYRGCAGVPAYQYRPGVRRCTTKDEVWTRHQASAMRCFAMPLSLTSLTFRILAAVSEMPSSLLSSHRPIQAVTAH